MNLSKIHHIAIIVSDYEAAKEFYVDVYKRQLIYVASGWMYYSMVVGL